MAISKTQPMRSAEIQLVDAVNAIMEEADIPADEVLQSLSATNKQVLLLTEEVDGMDADVRALNTFANRFKFGMTEEDAIAPDDTLAGSVAFENPFPSSANICVFLCCVGGEEILTGLECELISATYAGFSWAIKNTTEDIHDVALGYVAIRVN